MSPHQVGGSWISRKNRWVGGAESSMNSSRSASRLSVPVCIMGTRLDSSRQVERFARRSGAPFSTLGQEEGDKPRREKAKVTSQGWTSPEPVCSRVLHVRLGVGPRPPTPFLQSLFSLAPVPVPKPAPRHEGH